MSTFKVSDYWPFPRGDETLVNTFDSGTVHTYSAEPQGARLNEIVDGKWADDWLYRYDPKRGVLEYGDDYPAPWWMFWTNVRHQPFVPGKEIIWGNIQEIGDTVDGQCQTAGIFGQYGWQRVTFEKILPELKTDAGTFKDVLVLLDAQTWGRDGKSGGGRYWFAPGLGQVKVAWLTDGISKGYGMTIIHSSAVANALAYHGG